MRDAEIVKAVAEKVMRFYQSETVQGTQWVDGAGLCRGNVLLNEWNPLTNDADCMAVVDSITHTHDAFSLVWTLQKTWMCSIWNPKKDSGATSHVECPDRRRAICLAALRACGIDTDADATEAR